MLLLSPTTEILLVIIPIAIIVTSLLIYLNKFDNNATWKEVLTNSPRNKNKRNRQ